MKKFITPALAITLTVILFSCQKQKDVTLPASGTASTPLNKLEPLPPIRIPFTISEWFYVPLYTERDGGLYGSHELKKPLPGTTDTDVRLAYVRRNQGTAFPSDGVGYSQLPVVFNTSDGHQADMTFALGADLFEIFVKPIGILPRMLDPNEFKDCAYRFIVISKENYNTLNIDWSNYKEVASVLNFIP